MESHPDATIGFRHYPLTAIHPKAEDAALAAICAEEHGRFSQLHSLLFELTEWRDTGEWKTLAEKAGVGDLGSYERCLRGEAAGRRLEEDMRLGDALGGHRNPDILLPAREACRVRERGTARRADRTVALDGRDGSRT